MQVGQFGHDLGVVRGTGAFQIGVHRQFGEGLAQHGAGLEAKSFGARLGKVRGVVPNLGPMAFGEVEFNEGQLHLRGVLGTRVQVGFPNQDVECLCSGAASDEQFSQFQCQRCADVGGAGVAGGLDFSQVRVSL